MSLVIKKFAEGGSPEVRLYKRGNDEVDFNAFIRLAETGFNNWLDRVDIKEKYKKEVRAAYQDMITRMNDNPESFVARLGGGFTNTAGITNKTDGFDAYGVAAGYLGNTLRRMSAYTKPEVKSNKPKYDPNKGFITSDMLLQMIGNDPDSFIMLDNDSYDESTGLRGLTNRYTQLLKGLEALKVSLKGHWDSEDDYNSAVKRIDNAISALNNNNPNDDRFVLSLLGMTGLDKFLYTGGEKRTTPLTQEELTSLAEQDKIKNFENWMSSNRPIYTGDLDSISIGSNVGNASQQQITLVYNRLGSLDKSDLRNWLFDYIYRPDLDYTNYPTLIRLLGGAVPIAGTFTSSLIITLMLSRAVESGLGKKASDTLYYFPDTLERHSDGSSTVYAFNITTKALEQMDTLDIEDYRKLYLNEYTTANSSVGNSQSSSAYSSRYPSMYPSHKLGGILKAQQGIKFDNILEALTYLPEDLTADKRVQNLYKNGQFTYPIRTSLATDENAPGNDSYDIELGGPEVEATDYYKNWLNILTTNPTVAEAWAKRYRELQPTTSVHYSPWFNEDGSFNFEQFKNALVNNKKVYSDAVNGIGHDFYRGRVYQMLDENGNPLEGYYNSPLDGYELVGEPTLDEGNLAYVYKMRRKVPHLGYDADEPSDGSDFNEVTGDSTPYSDGTAPTYVDLKEEDLSQLDEVVAKLKSLSTRPNLIKSGFWSEIGTDLLGAGRLAGSIWANNRIARTVRESLRPKLHNTYELYSPVTGAFSEMLLRNRLGAKALSLSYKPFTSDSSLAAARMLQGQTIANQLQAQGFLADDQEIKRTQAEALLRLEGNIAKRSALANENRDIIINNNQAIALLEASRIKQNWNSIDNYLKGVEGRVRTRLQDDRDRRNQFAIQMASSSADLWKRGAIRLLMDRYKNWKAANPTDRATSTFTDWATLNSEEYSRAMLDINTITEAKWRKGYADIYGLNYEWPTYKDTEGVVHQLDFDINDYEWLKTGGSIRLNASQLIDKTIRRNNEGNS